MAGTSSWILYCLLIFSLSVTWTTSKTYLNKWAVEIEGGDQLADLVARMHGFSNLGRIGSLDNFYLFEHHEVTKRSTSPSRHHHTYLSKEPKVVWAEQQVVKKRVKRDFQATDWDPHFRDPLWPKQWYLNGGAQGGFDMNVKPVWHKGYTGKGVVVTILDDGIEHTHTDLRDNYDPDASLDINSDDKDPTPRYDSTDENRHGTRCAGEVAGKANNTKCGVGVAYGALIGGVRMLDGEVSDYVEAKALSLNPQHVDIYSASWGPDDNGKVVDGPATLAKKAFIQGVLQGRSGKGSIYVWASGNGGSHSDSCSCDGYTNSIFTLSVSSASEHGTKPWYLEECASTLATTYSSGHNYRERKIVTTDLHDRCTEAHTGTSASAPLAAGMCALALQANPDLSWRDMQYIVLMSSKTEPLQDGAWVTNGVGRKVSHRYGYGMMDGEAMVALAERWTPVPEQHICLTDEMTVYDDIQGSGLTVEVNTDGCAGTVNEIQYIEHVQAKVSLDYSRRGDLELYLVSPAGTNSTLLPRRHSDYGVKGFNEWPFMSVFYWGEGPQGKWKLQLRNTGSVVNSGALGKWQLILYGTKDPPVKLKAKPAPKPGTEDKPGKTTKPGETNNKDNERSGAIDNNNKEPSGEGDGEKKVTTPSGKDENAPDDVKPTKIIDHGGIDPDEGNEAGEVDTDDDGDSGIEGRDGDDSENSSDKSAPPDWSGKKYQDLCHEECIAEDGCTGTSADECVTCKHLRVGEAGPCVRMCPQHLPGYVFLSRRGLICHDCVSPCQTCKGPDVTSDCLSCVPSMYLIVDKGSCVSQCPRQYYLEEETNECHQCSPECAGCAGSADACTDCEEGLELQGETCVPQCARNQYRDPSGSCAGCSAPCDGCTGPTPSDCLVCALTHFYQNGTCVSQCSEGYFQTVNKESHEDVCLRCHPACGVCIGPTDEECLSCVPPLKMVNSACVEDCPPGQYEDDKGWCQSCHSTCETCKGAGPDNCLTCVSDRFLDGTSCVLSCREGYYEYMAVDLSHTHMIRECRRCHSSCATCDGGLSSECLSCRDGLYYDHGKCKTECDADEYEDKVNNQCLSCHPSCRSCRGPSPSDCTLCEKGFHLLEGSCLQECPQGFFSDPHNLCLRCHQSCLVCTGESAQSCSACKDNYQLYNGMCVLMTPTTTTTTTTVSHTSSTEHTVILCERRQYYSDRDGVCHLCDPTCDTCRGPGPTNCLSCSPPRRYYEEGHQCILCCSDSLQQNCCQCHPRTGTCLEDVDSVHTEEVQFFHPTAPGAKFATEFTTYITTSPHLRLHPNASPSPAVSRASSQVSGVVSFVIFFSILSVVLFFVIFGLLQARASDKLCWRPRYLPVPTSAPPPAFYQNGTNKVHLSKKDFQDEDEIYSSA